jgi:hypothetical protein
MTIFPVDPDIQPDKFVLNHSALKERPFASRDDIENVQSWLGTYDSAIDAEENSFFNYRGNLTNLLPSARTPLRRALEQFEAFCWSKLFQRHPDSYDSEKGEVPFLRPTLPLRGISPTSESMPSSRSLYAWSASLCLLHHSGSCCMLSHLHGS